MTVPSTAAGRSRSRGTKRGSARTTLLIVLGEFALPDETQPPHTSTLVRTLGEVGISRHAARQAIQRCARNGWISGVRSGRESQWAITPAGRELLTDGIDRVEALETDVEDWDGTWLVVVSSIPQGQRTVRESFYRALRWNGFGSPMPGVWISAHPHRAPSVRSAIDHFGLGESTASFTGVANGLGLSEQDLVARAWDLDALAERYQHLVARFSQRSPSSHSQALVALLELDGELQTVPSWDPQLPSALVPHWPGRDAATQLLGLRQKWIEPAREHWFRLHP